jgi:hypothetical protein
MSAEERQPFEDKANGLVYAHVLNDAGLVSNEVGFG